VLTEEKLLTRDVGLEGRSVIRLADFTAEPDAIAAVERGWRPFVSSGDVAQALGNGRLLLVATRSPSPPLFGVGFGVREQDRGSPSFHWAGRRARLLVPRSVDESLLLVEGRRFERSGATTVTVTESADEKLLVSRKVAPGPFQLLVPRRAAGAGAAPGMDVLVLDCDASESLPKLPIGVRPLEGCFVVSRAETFAPGETWERTADSGYRANVGAASDGLLDPLGFHDREREADGQDFRWTSERASILWLPRAGFRPTTLAVRWHAAGSEPLHVELAADDRVFARLEARPNGFQEAVVTLPKETIERLSSGASRIGFSTSPVRVGGDPRALGVAVDHVTLY
jgi:hypothetical protein